MNVSSSGPFNQANIFLGLIECELNSLLGAQFIFDSTLKDICQIVSWTIDQVLEYNTQVLTMH